jgi:hypothetical protein
MLSLFAARPTSSPFTSFNVLGSFVGFAEHIGLRKGDRFRVPRQGFAVLSGEHFEQMILRSDHPKTARD